MKIEEYSNLVAGEVARLLPETTVEPIVVQKNNDVTFFGMQIRKANAAIAPVIYIDEMFNDDLSVEDAAREVARQYGLCSDVSANVDFMKKWEEIKERVCFRLVNAKENEELLKTVPYFEFMDLAGIYYVEIGVGDKSGTIKITNSLLEEYGIPASELEAAAVSNTAKLHPGKRMSMAELIGMPDGMETPFEVWTNEDRTYGATAMVYGFGDESCCVLPSSIHEVLTYSLGEATENELKQTIREVNSAIVTPQERLSDNLYYWDGNMLSIVE